MLDASLGERSNIPAGILSAQNSIGEPKIRTVNPDALRWAAADNP
jgi:hypothetical protein